ncbi:helix-turn-helix transcriptional regulator [Streptomyces sp. SID13666]|uniref:winged helix-turn-helix transcriptional regulator n=1 Tax=unclassified Streptomyces TaxID=2593676 RepID=UPI0013BF8B25|nr:MULTISPECIES: helix-turn-helix domain-containing protein [unclassified Streptomyces]NEA60477.1 helix-turn-helix transcriptional regulator [Streptomyces sp. SID13666]NEA76866.1 helix-turn-helix transcriptional regulator [Streptomyces sp. SID13588]
MDTNPSAGLPIYQADCPARTVIELLANKWVFFTLILLRRHDAPMRFNEMRRQLGTVTQKMLAQTLRSLERDGLVRREVYPTVPPRVEYSLTRLGGEAARLALAIGDWSQEHLGEIEAARCAHDTKAAAAPQPLL